jgi:hypothetical protein
MGQRTGGQHTNESEVERWEEDHDLYIGCLRPMEPRVHLSPAIDIGKSLHAH